MRGRNGPYYIRGNTKRCTGPLCEGKYVDLRRFWFFKNGRRKGKPFSRCMDCENFRKFGDTNHGWIEFSKVKFVFDELVSRLGKMETCRRIGVSPNYFQRREKDGRIRVKKYVIRQAMIALQECRENNEVRHRHSIRHGAALRGKEERNIISRKDYYRYNYEAEGQLRNGARLTSSER